MYWISPQILTPYILRILFLEYSKFHPVPLILDPMIFEFRLEYIISFEDEYFKWGPLNFTPSDFV